MSDRKIQNQNRKFKGIWIPAEIWLNEDLTIMEIMLMTEISSLDTGNGAFPSNKYLAEFFGITPGRVSQIIKSLIDKGLINSTLIYRDGSKEVEKRILRVANSNAEVPESEPEKEEAQVEEQADEIPYAEIVDYLNTKAKTQFKPKSNKTKHFIRTRFDEGFKLDDFKRVIDNKVDDWLYDVKMRGYLRPETLFGSKFESYLNQSSIIQVFENNGAISMEIPINGVWDSVR